MEKQIIFRLKNQQFALPIMTVDKIIDTEDVMKVPDVEPYIMGVKEYDETVLPVVNLAKRFFQEELENQSEAQVIVVEWKESFIGLAVDEVTSIATYKEEELEQTSESTSLNSVSAFVQTEKGIVSLIDPERLLNEKGSEDIHRLLKIKAVDAHQSV